MENTFYLYSGAFYKFDFKENKWIPADTAVYSYIDYLTGIAYDWNNEKNSWEAKAGSIPLANNTVTQPNIPVAQKTDNKQQTVDKNKKKEGWVELSEDKNTNVYVSGLPLGCLNSIN